MAKTNWKKLSSKQIYKTPWIEVVEDQVIRPDGKKGIYSRIINKGAPVIIAEDEEGKVLLIRQHRYPTNKFYWEIPAGYSEKSKDLAEMAKQELFEETGLKPEKLEKIGEIIEVPLFITKPLSVFLATDFDKSKMEDNSEGNEIIDEIRFFTIKKLKSMIGKNEVVNAATLAALNLYFNKYDK